MANPMGLLFGFVSVAVSVALFLYAKNQYGSTIDSLTTGHPVATVALIFSASFFLMYLSDCVSLFLTATLFPLLLILCHASCRMRNLKNKLNDASESIGLKRSPMGIVLDYVQMYNDKFE